MSQPSSPARPVDPPRDPNTLGQSGQRPSQNAPDQAWKLAALAVALVILAVLLFFLFTGPTSEQSAAPQEEPAAEEEEAAEEPPPPPPSASSDDPRPSSHPSGGSSSGGSAPAAQDSGELPSLNVLSVGYSPTPALRVVALRIGGALPYFLHEGDSIGDLKILSIMYDRVQISHKGKKYEIKVGSDGQVRLPKGVK